MAVLTKITSRSLADNAVSSAKIQDGAIAVADVADGSISTAKLADDAVTTAKIGNDQVTAAKIPAGAVVADVGTGGIATANLADDAVTVAKLGTIQSVGESAPSSPYIGQTWFRLSNAVTYQYTNDGASSFWLDISSGGVGTSASRSVDIVGDTDPHSSTSTTGAGLAVGSIYYNRENNTHFTCSAAVNTANVWDGNYAGFGGIITDYLLGGVRYRVHTFLTSGTFTVTRAMSVDFLVVAGGGGAGQGGYGNGGGGGAGGLRSTVTTTGGGGSLESALAVTAQEYIITVGAGGTGGTSYA